MHCAISSDEKIGQHAAGFWEGGSPPRPGRYLCVYKGPGGRDVAVLDYVFDEETDGYRWQTGAREVKIVRWAEINT